MNHGSFTVIYKQILDMGLGIALATVGADVPFVTGR
jgi:hypothetical protein